MYVFGSAGTYAAYAANRQELDKWKIIPRMLRDATVRDLDVSCRINQWCRMLIPYRQTTLFGVKYKSPIIVAPVGVQGIVHADGEIATATAANNVGVTYVMSTASTRTIESVGKANGSGHRWYQLYW